MKLSQCTKTCSTRLARRKTPSRQCVTGSSTIKLATHSTAYISERSVSRFVANLNTILAAMLLFGAIVSLYYIKNENTLLGMVGGWTVLFASCLGLLTNARRDQIFGTTAAYAAVLVVFVSGNLGREPSGAGKRVCQMVSWWYVTSLLSSFHQIPPLQTFNRKF